MPTLYVENVPEELYETLRSRASGHRKSISAEVIELLVENVPTSKEVERRLEILKRARSLRSRRGRSSGPFPSSEEMQRHERGR